MEEPLTLCSSGLSFLLHSLLSLSQKPASVRRNPLGKAEKQPRVGMQSVLRGPRLLRGIPLVSCQLPCLMPCLETGLSHPQDC